MFKAGLMMGLFLGAVVCLHLTAAYISSMQESAGIE
jgi:hypothetical protein